MRFAAIASAADSPRRVEIHATLVPLGNWLRLFTLLSWFSAEGGRPQALLLGGSAKRSLREMVLGNIGGNGGGGGTPGATRVWC